MPSTDARAARIPGLTRAIGLMSGTSLDGIDAALMDTDGAGIVRRGASLSIPYTIEDRLVLATALEAAKGWDADAPMPSEVAEAERLLTLSHVLAVKKLLKKAKLRPSDVDLVGFHGQTVLHAPALRRTVQIGMGDVLARLTGIDVVNDFRSADVAAGGEGAPLVPLYHRALVAGAGLGQPVALINIGGVSNVTFIGANGAGEAWDEAEGGLLAFDTGPGNALIDDWAMRHKGEPVDWDGALAASGRVDEGALARLLDHPFFDQPPPKSLDRFSFSPDAVAHLSAADGAATLTAFTAAAIARAVRLMPQAPTRLIVCGGGRHNPVLMEALRRASNITVEKAEDRGWRGDDIEAEAFAYLAVRAKKGLPLSLPATTGVPEPMRGGRFHTAG